MLQYEEIITPSKGIFTWPDFLTNIFPFCRKLSIYGSLLIHEEEL
jgi:hypothetical protein